MTKAKYTKGQDGYFKTRVWDGTLTELGKKRYVTIRSKKSSRDLENKVIEYNQMVRERKAVRKSDISFYSYAQKWRQIYKASRSKNTHAMYDNIIEHYFSDLKYVCISEVSRQQYQATLNKAEGKSRVQQQIALTFKQVVKSAILDQYLPANAIDMIFTGTESIKYTPTEKRALMEHEKDALFKADLSDSDRAFAYLLYGCGIRRGEALALTKDKIDLKAHTLTVNQSLAFDGNNPYLKTPKTKNGYRAVPIPDIIYPFIAEYISRLPGEKLFYMSGNRWVTQSSYVKMWKRILRKMQEQTEIPIVGLTAHVFRHNYCTNLCYQMPAISIKKIASLLGDTDKVVMEVYNHMILEKEDACEAVNNAVNF